jgi:DNA-binding MarR family transcriptional regulator
MRPNPEDGRSKCVWITEAGRALREQTIGALAQNFAALAEAIPPDRVAEVLPLLTEVREYLDRARD